MVYLLVTAQAELQINDSYLELVPALNLYQRRALKQDIKDNGQLEPIICNQNHIVLDGHNRFAICKELGIIPKFTVRHFDNEKDEILYIITVNVKRRQLNPFQQFEMVEKLRDKMIEERKRRSNSSSWQTRKGLQDPQDRSKSHWFDSTDHQLAMLSGLKPSWLQVCVYIKTHGDKKLIEKVRNGTWTINHAKVILMKKIAIPKKYSVVSKIMCKSCGSKCREKTRCHVHKNRCCTNCEWGE